MRIYIVVALLTFAGSFAVYSGSRMFSAAGAITGNRSGASAASFNPFALLQPDRLRAVAGSRAGLPRMEAFRPNFDASALRGLRGPAIDANIGRNVYISPPPQIRVPQIHTPPPVRIYR
jgi:hypothetical protein